MTIPFIKDYKKGNYSFPSDEVPLNKRDDKWYKQVGEMILSEYSNDRCGILYSERDRIGNNRAWADGTNSEETFKDIILDFQRDEAERKAFSNIDYAIIPILSKFKSVFVGIMCSTKHRATANSIDPVSIQKKTKAKMKLWLRKKFEDILKPLDQALGVKPEPGEYIPQSKAELDMYEQFGGFKLAIETAIENGIKHCFDFSLWDENIRPQLAYDYFTNNMFACRDYFDPETYTIKSEYIDVANIVVQASNDQNYSTSRYKGYFKFITIADLRVLTANQEGWTDEKIKEIAKKYATSFTNDSSVNFGNIPIGDQRGPYEEYQRMSSVRYSYDPYLIPILVAEYLSTIYEHDVEKVDAAGNVSYYKTDRNRNYNRQDRKSITTPIRVWHRLSMVVGTGDVFDYGLQHDIPRPKYEDPRSSIHIYKGRGKSYCERAIPHAKQIQLMYLKIQALALKAKPPGTAFDYDSLRGMIMNKKELQPWEVLKIYNETGNIGYKNTNTRGHPNNQGGNPPIKELKGSYSLADLLGVIANHKMEIRELTGIDESVGKTEPTAYQAQMKSMFTDIALKEAYISYTAITKEVAVNSAARLRDLLAYSEKAREIYAPIIGLTNMEMLNMVSDLPMAHLSINIEIEPTDEDKQVLIDASIAAMKPGKEGVPVLRFSDFLFIQRLAKTGNIKYGHAYIAHKEAEIEKEGRARAAENAKMNEQIAINTEKAKTESFTATKKLETDEDIRLFEAQKDKENWLAEQQHTRNLEIERLKLQAKQSEPAPV